MSRGSVGELWLTGWRSPLRKEALLCQRCSAWKLRPQAVHGSYSCSKAWLWLTKIPCSGKSCRDIWASPQPGCTGSSMPTTGRTQKTQRVPPAGTSLKAIWRDAQAQDFAKRPWPISNKPAHPRTASSSWGSQSPPEHSHRAPVGLEHCLYTASKGTIYSFTFTNCYRTRIPRMAQTHTNSNLGTFRLLFYSKLCALPASKKQMENMSLNVHPCDHSKRKEAPSSLKRLLEKVFSISCK